MGDEVKNLIHAEKLLKQACMHACLHHEIKQKNAPPSAKPSPLSSSSFSSSFPSPRPRDSLTESLKKNYVRLRDTLPPPLPPPPPDHGFRVPAQPRNKTTLLPEPLPQPRRGLPSFHPGGRRNPPGHRYILLCVIQYSIFTRHTPPPQNTKPTPTASDRMHKELLHPPPMRDERLN